MGCKQLWYQHAFHVKQGHEDMWCVCMCVCVHACVCVFVLRCLAHFHGGVCYPCLLESDRRLCLIGVFTLSGLTHTDTLDLGALPFAMKRENSDTETFLLCREEKLCCYLAFSFFFVFYSVCLSSALVVCFNTLLHSFLHMKA